MANLWFVIINIVQKKNIIYILFISKKINEKEKKKVKKMSERIENLSNWHTKTRSDHSEAVKKTLSKFTVDSKCFADFKAREEREKYLNS